MSNAHEPAHRQARASKPSRQSYHSGGGRRGSTNPSPSSRFRCITCPFRLKRRHSRAPRTPARPVSAARASVVWAGARRPQQRRESRRDSPGPRACRPLSWSKNPTRKGGAGYYAHRKVPWSSAQTVDYKPGSRSHGTARHPKSVPPGASMPEHGAGVYGRATKDQSRGLNGKPLSRSTTMISAMSISSRSITIGFDNSGLGQESSGWTAVDVDVAKCGDQVAPDMTDPETLEDVKRRDMWNAVSQVYQHEFGPARNTNAIRPATMPPSPPSQHQPTPGPSTTAQSPNETDNDQPWRESTWEDETPLSTDVPTLTPPHTAASTSTESDVPTPTSKALPPTPGLPCPGCLIGGRRSRTSSRGTPRGGHRGSLQFPEERESGFCNACQRDDLLPDISRFTVAEARRTTLFGRGDARVDGDRSSQQLRVGRRKGHIKGGEAGRIRPHVLNSKFRLGTTKESNIASRRKLNVDDGLLHPAPVPLDEKMTIMGHIAECKLLDSPNSNYDESPSTGDSIQLPSSLPVHFNIDGQGLVEPLRLSTQVADRSLSQTKVKGRRSRRCDIIINSTVSEINTALEDWEADIFRDYGAITPMDVTKAPLSPPRPLIPSPGLTITEEVRECLGQAILDILSAKPTEPEEESPRTHKYNHHKRANGDF